MMRREVASALPWYGFSVENQVWNFYSLAQRTTVSKIKFLYIVENYMIFFFFILCYLQK